MWRADEVNDTLAPDDILLTLFDPDTVQPAAFVEMMIAAGELGIPLGVLPVYEPDRARLDFSHLLGSDHFAIDFSRCRFRLSGSPAADAPDAPTLFRRALDDTPAFVTDDLQADLLFLQGHAGPFDGSFGPSLTLCSRALHGPGRPVFVPCADTETCFRQSSRGRPDDSSEGLVDPRLLQSTLVIGDGCGTFPLPGSLYRYEQSLMRGLLLSRVRSSVLSVGVSATPLSVVVLMMGMLASGRMLGQAVLETNRHRRAVGSPSSVGRAAIAPWIVVGNPAAVVAGLSFDEHRVRPEADGALRVDVDSRRDTGTLVALRTESAIDGAFDVACDPSAWVSGALHGDRLYLWVHAAGNADREQGGTVRLTLSRRADAHRTAWRDRLLWLRAGTQWLHGLSSEVARRDRDAQPLLDIIAIRDELAGPVEQAASAAIPWRSREISPALATSAAPLETMLERLDRATTLNVAAALPFAGARLSHLWSPPWLHDGDLDVSQSCLCGCPIVGHVRRHPLNDLRRIELSCPSRSLIGDTAAEVVTGSGAVVPLATASIGTRSLTAGERLHWSVALTTERCAGFACSTLFDPYRAHRVTSTVAPVDGTAPATVAIDVPHGWPVGLSWATLTCAAGGRICLFAFDIEVRRAAPLP